MRILRRHAAPGIPFREIQCGELFYILPGERPEEDEIYMRTQFIRSCSGVLISAVGMTTGKLVRVEDRHKVFRVHGHLDVENIGELKRAESDEGKEPG